jgi:hypothetical protein
VMARPSLSRFTAYRTVSSRSRLVSVAMDMSSVWACRGSFVAVRNPPRAPAGHARGAGPARTWRTSSGRAQVHLARARIAGEPLPRHLCPLPAAAARRVASTRQRRRRVNETWGDVEEGRGSRSPCGLIHHRVIAIARRRHVRGATVARPSSHRMVVCACDAILRGVFFKGRLTGTTSRGRLSSSL